MEDVLILLYLSACARSDIRWGYISLPLSLIVLLIRVICLLLLGRNPLAEIGGIGLGVFLYLVYLISGQVGEGDALLIGVIGYVLGMRESVRILMIALVLLFVRKGWERCIEKNVRYPFAPYVLAGFFVSLIRMQEWPLWR